MDPKLEIALLASVSHALAIVSSIVFELPRDVSKLWISDISMCCMIAILLFIRKRAYALSQVLDYSAKKDLTDTSLPISIDLGFISSGITLTNLTVRIPSARSTRLTSTSEARTKFFVKLLPERPL